MILLSIPAAVSIHTVTAFLYNGLAARPFWNASILAPRFLASAFCSGPALMIILFQLIRRYTRIDIKNEAIFKIAELIAYSMFLNLFLLGAEVFKEFYSGTIHLAPMQYLFFGLKGHNDLVPCIWMAMIFNAAAFLLFLVPRTRENHLTLNIGCVLIFVGVYIEKGIGAGHSGTGPRRAGGNLRILPHGHRDPAFHRHLGHRPARLHASTRCCSGWGSRSSRANSMWAPTG